MLRRKASAILAGVMVLSVISGCAKKPTRTTRDPEDSSGTSVESTSDTTSGSTTENTTVPDEPGLNRRDPDQVLFTYERYNYAWTPQEAYIFVMGDGRLYSYSGDIPFTTDFEKSPDSLKKFEILRTLKPFAVMDESYLQLLYITASKIDPDAPTERKHAACDFGQIVLYYWQEDGTKVRCFETGDVDYIIDDANAKNMEQLWENAGVHVNDADGPDTVTFLTDESFTGTIHCGYVALDKNDSGKYLFTSFKAFEKKAKEWGVDISSIKIPAEKEDFYRAKAVFVQLDIVPTTGYNRDYDAFIVADSKTCSFHPSKEWANPDPDSIVGDMMDGFLTYCMYKEVSVNETEFLTEDGGTWQVVD